MHQQALDLICGKKHAAIGSVRCVEPRAAVECWLPATRRAGSASSIVMSSIAGLTDAAVTALSALSIGYVNTKDNQRSNHRLDGWGVDARALGGLGKPTGRAGSFRHIHQLTQRVAAAGQA